MTKARVCKTKRSTKETQIEVAVNVDGTGVYNISTGVGFLDHMIEQLSKHSLMDLDVNAKGDIHIDYHHTTEDSGYAIGDAIQTALGARVGIVRYGNAKVPMDETLSEVSLDISGRPYLSWHVTFPSSKVGDMDTELFKEWFQAFAQAAGITLHVENIYGDNSHHIIESCFKSMAVSLRSAIQLDFRNLENVPSTKGTLTGNK